MDKKDKLKVMIKNDLLIIIGAVIGIIGGYLYWRFVGCTGSNCMITSSPWMSAIWGGVMCGLLFSIFKKSNKRTNKTDDSK